MRFAIVAALILAGCGSQPAARDATKESWYRDETQQLATMARQAENSFRAGRADEASATIQKAEPIQKRLLGVPHPSLEAAEAASDLDDLYGRMLLSNRHYGWAQMMFQKNLSRWKHWEPQTEETARRLKLAESEIAECSRKMEQ